MMKENVFQSVSRDVVWILTFNCDVTEEYLNLKKKKKGFVLKKSL